ncbi:MAG: hypothetical protein ACR2JR_04035 [Rubrobacteraceae bacterium]
MTVLDIMLSGADGVPKRTRAEDSHPECADNECGGVGENQQGYDYR